jgi:Fur family transcriptional regulator, ferric uptake regulator
MKVTSLGQRQTRQRDAILKVLTAANGPLSVPEIYKLAKKGNPLGIATVYRAINLLLEAKQIQSVILPSGETRYESADLGHHDHFQCRNCGHVYDLSVCPLHLASGTIIPGGFIVEDHEMTLYGTCPDCASTNGKKPTGKKPVAKKSHAGHSHKH